MSPRRSSRARITQPSSALSHSHAASSNTSSKERNSRSTLTLDDRILSQSPEPSSLDESDNNDARETAARLTRQSRRGQTSEQEFAMAERHKEGDEDGEVEGDEEEITRCVCRRADYPGPPVPVKEMSPPGNESFPEDAGSLFIQCDVCKVWQHGGCVGIMDEAMCPDNYYCEQCRADLHRILTGAKGQRYSRYLPVVEPAQMKSSRRLSSVKRDTDMRALKDPESRPLISKSQQQHNSRHQRITNNSRAAYEEEQMLLKALEASKVNSDTHGMITVPRNMKRDRDDSEGSNQEMKRRKTDSQSDSAGHDGEEDDSDQNSLHTGMSKSARGIGAQAQREREARDHEKERERVRAEAAGRRKGRAERRNAEGSEPPDEAPGVLISGFKKDAKINKNTAARLLGPGPGAVAKKNFRPKRGRAGRNQYTRDRDGDLGESPSTARDSDGTANEMMIVLLPNGSKPARPRHINPNRTSMNELRKRAAGILEFISRTQIEIAGEHAASVDSITPGLHSPHHLGPAHQQLESAVGEDCLEPGNDDDVAVGGSRGSKERSMQDSISSGSVDETLFSKLSSLQMMDVLTREIVLWQKSHGKWGERA